MIQEKERIKNLKAKNKFLKKRIKEETKALNCYFSMMDKIEKYEKRKEKRKNK